MRAIKALTTWRLGYKARGGRDYPAIKKKRVARWDDPCHGIYEYHSRAMKVVQHYWQASHSSPFIMASMEQAFFSTSV